MPMNNSTRNRAAAAFLAVLAAVGGGTAYFVWDSDHTHVRATWKDAPKGPINFCWFGVLRSLDKTAYEALELKAEPGALIMGKVPFYEPVECLTPGAKLMADVKLEDVDYKVQAEAREAAVWALLVGNAVAKASGKPVEPVKEEPKDDPLDLGPGPEETLTTVNIDVCPTRVKVLPAGIETGPDEWVEPCGPDSVFEAWVVGHADAPLRCSCSDAKGTKYPMLCGCWTANCGIPEACKVDPCRGGKWACGDDPYGGSCGHCKEGQECIGHACVALPGPDAGLDASR